jgi:hypothetical protein
LIQKRKNLIKWFIIARLNKTGQAETNEYSRSVWPFPRFGKAGLIFPNLVKLPNRQRDDARFPARFGKGICRLGTELLPLT